MRRVPIERDFESWRRAARRLLAAGVLPDEVVFDDGGDAMLPGLADDAGDAAVSRPVTAVPKGWVRQAAFAADHRDGDRWRFLYAMLWRLRDDPRLAGDLTDPDVRRLDAMVKGVRRDVHKMHAFVRFRKVKADDGTDRYVAFHRPDHYIVRRAAPFFRERFGGMRWAILTPDESVSWDGHRLCFGIGVPATAAPDGDALEDLWRTYYASVFNPARPKVRAMKSELPVRHWRTLPEAQIIPDLLLGAKSRTEDMVAATAKQPKPKGAAEFIPAEPSIEVMKAAVQGCKGCDLCCNGSTQAVFGEGPASARCVMVGEQPGDNEDRVGRPFVGPAGQLMDELLHEAGVDRKLVYVTNTVKHFHFVKKGKFRLHQKPMARHVTACKPWLERELEVIKPPLLVALGSTAAQAVMGRDFRVTQSRGEPMASAYAPWFMATIHPSAILRIPADADRERARADFVSDMRQVAAAMAGV